MNIGLVCLLGMGIVFLGLICIVYLCKGMSAVVRLTEKTLLPADESKGRPVKLATPAATDVRPEPAVVAAVSAAIAEELGESVSSFRILKIRKI